MPLESRGLLDSVTTGSTGGCNFHLWDCGEDMGARLISALLATVAYATPLLSHAQGHGLPSQQRCDQLLAYYDRYFASNREGSPAPGGLDKIIGWEACREKNFSEGVSRLELAIRKNGFEPPAPLSPR